ncbi:adenylyl-sulfate kinase [Niabella ginsenosidivorans]|uniref:Adenylyl-sulfate kinase n=1 Tax=Niabella ginsenosidivorans TaxID=1176587 RepID=A0A1A9IBB5_9BACT|nr:adenylyl-sulfate kinase [Niabella ginsenosidivorans]ANH83864.1 adenylyl-sulfate kinase [Niabella ginsenosidivorans]
MIIQLCGMSGAGKTTISDIVQRKAAKLYGIRVAVIDGDVYRRTLNRDLGYSKQDRIENIKRLGKVAYQLSRKGIVAIISAINPYRDARNELKRKYPAVKEVFIDCPLEVLIERDTKGLYKKASLPEDHPDKLKNLSGLNDPFEKPEDPDLHLRTDRMETDKCAQQLIKLIVEDTSADLISGSPKST